MSLYLGENLISGTQIVTDRSERIGQIITSTIPLTDAGLHLLDGSLIQGSGSYADFVDYIAALYNTDPTANFFAQADGLPWTQPVLTANGTIGGDNFACFSSSEYSSNYYTYKAFDGNITASSNYTYWCSSSNSGTQYIGFYNPIEIKVTKLRLYNQTANSGDGIITSGIVQASNDNSTYTDIGSFSGNTFGMTYIDVNLDSNTNYYKYYRIVATGYSGSYATMGELVITAFSKDSTAEEWWQSQVSQYGVCGKFVYDSVNNTVRLPKYSDKIWSGGGIANAKGNGMTLGLTDGSGNYGLGCGSGAGDVSFSSGTYGTSVGSSLSGNYSTNKSVGITTDPTKSGIITDLSTITTALDGYWYIVIATSTKTDIEVDIDEVMTDLNGKADVDLSNMNPTQTVKNTIVGWGKPDYTAGVELNINTPSTFDAYWYGYHNGSYCSWTIILPTGETINLAATLSAGLASSCCMFIPKGSYYTYSYNNWKPVLYPLKGQ